jgi:hypothetical protein
MRLPLSLLVTCAFAVIPIARVCAQQTPTQPAATSVASMQSATPRAAATAQPVKPPPAAAVSRPEAAQAPPHSPAQHAPAGHAADARHGSAPSAESGGVLNLGATDITGNKELPKVMVIVPWKGSLGASGVIKPTDSLMDEVLQPVDRSVFQRRIRYYGQLNAAPGRPPAGQVAPVGDTH